MNRDDVPTSLPMAVYAFARAVEDTMAWIYRTAATLAPDDGCRDLLASLSQTEEGHARQLADTYPNLEAALASSGGQPSEWTVSRFRKAVIPSLDLGSLRSLLTTAYRLEKGGGELYREVAARSDAAAERELAERLQALEQAHSGAVAERFSSIFAARVEDEPGALAPVPWPRW